MSPGVAWFRVGQSGGAVLRYRVGVIGKGREEFVSLSCGDVLVYLCRDSYLQSKKFIPVCHL